MKFVRASYLLGDQGGANPGGPAPGNTLCLGSLKNNAYLNLTMYEKSHEEARPLVQNYKNQG